MVVGLPMGDDALPVVLLDLDACTLDGVDVVDEVPPERQCVLLDRVDAVLLGEGVGRLLLRVGRQHP